MGRLVTRSLFSAPHVAVTLLCTAGALLVGCTGHLNQEDDLLGEGLPDLNPHLSPDQASSTPAPLSPPEPSLTREHDRSHWARTTISVERRQVEVQPWYVTRPSLDRTTARSRGEYPTIASALEEDGDGDVIALEGALAPLWAIGDLLWSPVRMLQTPPGTTIRVPHEPPTLLAPDPSAPVSPPHGRSDGESAS